MVWKASCCVCSLRPSDGRTIEPRSFWRRCEQPFAITKSMPICPGRWCMPANRGLLLPAETEVAGRLSFLFIAYHFHESFLITSLWGGIVCFYRRIVETSPYYIPPLMHTILAFFLDSLTISLFHFSAHSCCFLQSQPGQNVPLCFISLSCIVQMFTMMALGLVDERP